jgi:cytochrome c oxidase subunit IV
MAHATTEARAAALEAPASHAEGQQHPIRLYLAVWGWLFIPSALLLVLSFPRRVWPVSRWPHGAAVLIFGLPTAGAAFGLVTTDLRPYGALLTLGALAVW